MLLGYMAISNNGKMRSERGDFGFGTGETRVLVIGKGSLENREVLERLVLFFEFNQKKKVINSIA